MAKRVRNMGVVVSVEGDGRLSVREDVRPEGEACASCKLSALCGSKGAPTVEAVAAPGYAPRVGDRVELTAGPWLTPVMLVRIILAPALVAVLSFVYPQVMVLPLLLYLIPNRRRLTAAQLNPGRVPP